MTCVVQDPLIRSPVSEKPRLLEFGLSNSFWANIQMMPECSRSFDNLVDMATIRVQKWLPGNSPVAPLAMVVIVAAITQKWNKPTRLWIPENMQCRRSGQSLGSSHGSRFKRKRPCARVRAVLKSQPESLAVFRRQRSGMLSEHSNFTHS